MEPVSLLTAIDCTAHIHLIVGSNPLAAARCAKSLQVGAKPLLIAPETAELHYALQKRIEGGEVEWLKKSFEESDALSLGREEIGGVVDAVFVTYGPRDPLNAETVLKSYAVQSSTAASHDHTRNSPSAVQKRGRIVLAGSGPGHPDLLTRATHKAILSADLILADKLVPSGVLDLIPRRTPVHIARKFPGNAEQAQEELLSLALEGVKSGKTVLRLKQGDPYIYGRGGEEYEFFRKEGYEKDICVLPGITSALSAPMFATIPATQRGVSDQVLICTGTGRKGKPSTPPEYVPTRTVVFLMALHRIEALVKDLTTWDSADAKVFLPSENGKEVLDKTRKLWPSSTPCAVIERASCPDQRVIRTTLEFVANAIESEGSRPPGLLVVGKSCEALMKGDPARKWIVEEGFSGLEFDEFPGVEELVIGDQLNAGKIEA
ncbi:putative Uroporphyrinogen-III C-methyltransferase [Glarea lozoyensis 74030]|uniref:uroporphyrinogen-III C-methyltransferase n=1 Tax=Glarea lozoyensis (strain ATCC 74030 / MF5533) TaxID=1104152 RepID=H0EV82_GLAL7|nr:putative Uroporphyrinogen-III C-methyltransferase [Glarea lozoyensis 74030]